MKDLSRQLTEDEVEVLSGGENINRNETKATALLSLSSPRASGMRWFFRVTRGLMRPPRSVSRLSYPEADEQRAWAWVGWAGLRPLRVGRRGILEMRVPPPPILSCAVAEGLAYPSCSFSYCPVSTCPTPPPCVKWASNSPITCSLQHPLQRSLQGTRPGPNCRLCPGLVGGGGPRHQGVQGGPGPPFVLSHLCPCFGLCLMQTLNLSHLGSLLLRIVPERKREKERVRHQHREGEVG